MVFHAETVNLIASRRISGGLFRAASENHGLAAGLRQRCEDIAPLAFDALDLAFQSRLLTLEWPGPNLRQGTAKYSRSSTPTPPESRKMLDAAKRLGHWFASVHPNQLFDLLGLYF